MVKGSVVKNLPTVQETQEMWVQSLSQEDPWEEDIATHSSILTWQVSWKEEPGRLRFTGLKESGMSEVTKNSTVAHQQKEVAYVVEKEQLTQCRRFLMELECTVYQ